MSAFFGDSHDLESPGNDDRPGSKTRPSEPFLLQPGENFHILFKKTIFCFKTVKAIANY